MWQLAHKWTACAAVLATTTSRWSPSLRRSADKAKPVHSPPKWHPSVKAAACESRRSGPSPLPQ